MTQTVTQTAAADAPHRPTRLQGLLMLTATAVFVGIYILLSQWLSLVEPWAGFTWLLYWAGIRGSQRSMLLPSVIGACAGIGLAWLLTALPALWGNAGLAVALGCVVLSVYCLIMRWAALIVNESTMLFLTVCTIPYVSGQGRYPAIVASLLLGVAFFASVILSATAIASKRAPAAGAASA